MNSDSGPSLGDYIADMRERIGMSAKQLAREAGTAASNISRIESGETATPTPELLKKIADVLDIDFAKLLKMRGIEIEAPNLETYLRRNYHMSQEGIAEAKAAFERIAQKQDSKNS